MVLEMDFHVKMIGQFKRCLVEFRWSVVYWTSHVLQPRSDFRANSVGLNVETIGHHLRGLAQQFPNVALVRTIDEANLHRVLPLFLFNFWLFLCFHGNLRNRQERIDLLLESLFWNP